MPYGLGEWKDEVMPESVAFSILDEAWASGINTLDTANSYGLSEERIAKFLRLNPQKSFHIISKFKGFCDNSQSATNLDWIIENSGFKELPNCSSYHLLIHDERDLDNKYLIEKLENLQNSNLISGWGVSLYTKDSLQKITSFANAELINVPVNIFNKQFVSLDDNLALQLTNKHLFARSVLAQGLVLKTICELSEKNVEFAKSVEFVAQRAYSVGLSLAQFAVFFALAQRSIKNVVVGFDSPHQVSALCVQKLIGEYHHLDPVFNEVFDLPDFLLARPETWVTK